MKSHISFAIGDIFHLRYAQSSSADVEQTKENTQSHIDKEIPSTIFGNASGIESLKTEGPLTMNYKENDDDIKPPASLQR